MTQAERRERAERRLLEAALEVVARRGSVRMTLAEVGEAAGYSRGLPAHRFGSKGGLVRALAAYIGRRFAQRRAAALRREPGLDAIRGNLSFYFGRDDQGFPATRALLVMMTEGFMEPSGLREDMAAYNRSAIAWYENQIRVGIDKGEIRDDADPRATAVLLLGAMRGVMLQWLLDPSIELARVRDRLLEIVDAFLARPEAIPASAGAAPARRVRSKRPETLAEGGAKGIAKASGKPGGKPGGKGSARKSAKGETKGKAKGDGKDTPTASAKRESGPRARTPKARARRAAASA